MSSQVWRVDELKDFTRQGPDAGQGGFLCMTDDWFSEYLFALACPRSHVAKALLDIYDRAEVVSLPPWDPLGAAA